MRLFRPPTELVGKEEKVRKTYGQVFVEKSDYWIALLVPPHRAAYHNGAQLIFQAAGRNDLLAQIVFLFGR